MGDQKSNKKPHLTKGHSSSQFVSFRFNPENEEIQEILEQAGGDKDDFTDLSSSGSHSLPGSPKPQITTGDTSPIKEYLRKNWDKKWDKKSLSLDLDLKEKIMSAIEDKRKSIVSHFIPEEGIPTAPVGVMEHSGVCEESTNADFSFDSSTQKLSSATGASAQGDSSSSSTVDDDLEVGLDCFASLEMEIPFQFPGDSLQDIYNGDAPGTVYTAGPYDEDYDEELKLTTVIWSMFNGIAFHPWTKYLIGALGFLLFVPVSGFFANVVWFVMGIICSVIIGQSLTGNCTEKKDNDKAENQVATATTPTAAQGTTDDGGVTGTSVSQGWLTEFDGNYDPFTNNIRQNRIVFARLENSNLTISYPHSKFRIPKRRLWSDPPLPTIVTFTRHSVYNLQGAMVFIAPEKLVRKRTWNKKYPIGIRLPRYSLMALHLPEEESEEKDVPGTNKGKSAAPSPTAKRRASITREDVGDKVLYLFTRSDREKDDWYRRLTAAAMTRDASYGSRLHAKEQALFNQTYLSYMRSIIPTLNQFSEKDQAQAARAQTPTTPTLDKKKKTAQNQSQQQSPSTPFELIDPQLNPVFLNAFLGRIFFDFLRSPHWTTVVSNLIQKKLNYIRRPGFLDVLTLKGLELGKGIPFIHRASQPTINSQGVWIDLDITYEGNLTLTLETKLDLMKLRKSPTNEEEENQLTTNPPPAAVPAMYDNEADDSGESSEEELDPDDFLAQHPIEEPAPGQPPPPTRGARFLRLAEKIANSNFVTDLKFVKKTIANVANTPLVLSVELKSCSGTLAINIPHPPTDRMWMGFRNNPNLVLVCRPKFGERSLNLTHVTEWIRKKLVHEFQRVLVLPNMDDITIPLLEFKLPNSPPT